MRNGIVRVGVTVALLLNASLSEGQSARCPSRHRASVRTTASIPDRDGDGILDDEDLCTDEPAGSEGDPRFVGCPARDRDGDRTPDHLDACPLVHDEGNRDPLRPGCPAPASSSGAASRSPNSHRRTASRN